MRNRDVENYIKTSTAGFAPDILPAIMGQYVEPLPVKTAAVRERRVLLPRLAAAIAVFAIIVVSAVFGYTYLTGESGTVYLDINPSVGLTVNRLNRIKQIEYFNEEAEALFINYKAKGKKAEDVLEHYLLRAAEEGYFGEEDAQLYLSAYAKRSEDAEKLLSSLNRSASGVIEKRGFRAEINRQICDAQEKSRAQALNISAGKLKVIESIRAQEPAYTIEELRGKSMSELKALLRSLSEDENGNGSGNDNGNGNGNGKGNGNRK